MTKKDIYVLVFLILLVSSGLFYWFQWRPSRIRMECTKIVAETTIELTKLNRIFPTLQEQDKSYNDCLHGKGIK